MDSAHKRFFTASMAVIILTGMLFFPGPAAADERLSIKVSIANIRSGPGTQNKVLWKVERLHPIRVVEKKGNWYRFVDFEGDNGWIHNSLVSSTPSIIVKRENCNVRSAPGLDSSIVFTAERGVPFRELERQGKWVHIQHSDGDKGWIHQSLVW